MRDEVARDADSSFGGQVEIIRDAHSLKLLSDRRVVRVTPDNNLRIPQLGERRKHLVEQRCVRWDLPSAGGEHRIGTRRERDRNYPLRKLPRISFERSHQLFRGLIKLPV